jgi:hypothetical protein
MGMLDQSSRHPASRSPSPPGRRPWRQPGIAKEKEANCRISRPATREQSDGTKPILPIWQSIRRRECDTCARRSHRTRSSPRDRQDEATIIRVEVMMRAVRIVTHDKGSTGWIRGARPRENDGAKAVRAGSRRGLQPSTPDRRGSPDPAVRRTEGLLWRGERETFGRPRGKFGRRGHIRHDVSLPEVSEPSRWTG